MSAGKVAWDMKRQVNGKGLVTDKIYPIFTCPDGILFGVSLITDSTSELYAMVTAGQPVASGGHIICAAGGTACLAVNQGTAGTPSFKFYDEVG